MYLLDDAGRKVRHLGFVSSAVLSAFISLPSLAQSPLPQDILQLRTLNQQGFSQQAYSFANRVLAQWEGEPAFDLEYGVAAINSGFVSEGIFALERVLMVQPTNDFARLELARAYFGVEEDDRARSEFEKVLANNPPREVRLNVRPYLDAIDARESRRRTTWRLTAEASGGHDSNINAAPGDADFFIPLLNGVATLNSTATADEYSQLALNGSVSRPMSLATELFGSASYSQRENLSETIDTASLSGQVGMKYRQDAGVLTVALQGSHFSVDSESYRDMVGVLGSWRHSISPQSAVTTYIQLSQLDYPNQPISNADVSTAGLSIQHAFASELRPVLSLGISYGQEDAESSEDAAQAGTEREIAGVNLGLSVSFSPSWQLSNTLRFTRSHYGAPSINSLDDSDADADAPIAVVRDDSNVSLTSRLSWRAADDWLIGLGVTLTENDSSLAINSYEREQVSLSARYIFK